MPNPKYPRARGNDLVGEDAQNELVVYDTRTDKAYVLNPSAAAVWRACNGKRSVQEIAHYLNQISPTDEQTVQYALGQLHDLLEQPADTPREFLKMSRRDFLKRAGLVATAAAIPVVVKIVAPTPANAQSASGVCCICTDDAHIWNSLGNLCPDDCSDDCGSHGGVQNCTSNINDCIA